jgi:hypothetical protein
MPFPPQTAYSTSEELQEVEQCESSEKSSLLLIIFFEKTQKDFAFHFIEKEREIGLLLQPS